jgi:small subunit ribosomal protein S15
MYLTAEIKKKMFKEHGGTEKNTGSSEGQIALFTLRINYLTKHLQENPKDVATKRSLVNLVGKRKSLLEYLKAKDITKYRALIKKLDIRR